MTLKEITTENTFSAKKDHFAIGSYKECLEKFGKNFDYELTLETNSPIFLDTNILLRYYSISFTARQKLFEFIVKHSKRIFLTAQVQFEFLKNREDIIQRFFEQVTNKIPRDFNSDIVNKLKNFLEQHKVVLKDYPFMETGIAKHQSELEGLLQKLNETVEEKRTEHINLLLNDKFLELLLSCNLLDNLTSKEIETIKKDFDGLSKNIQPENVDAILNKPNSAFPGLGDIRSKPENPYGDYLIFHEIMKYMMTNSVDAIFLTFDNTKGDWLNKNKAPHLHYVLNTFANTGQLMYIIDAERTLGELLNVDINSLVVDSSEPLIPVTLENISLLFEKDNYFDGAISGVLPKSIIEELKFYGYTSMNQIERELSKTRAVALEFIGKEGKKLSKLGRLKLALRLANSNYVHFIDKGGNFFNVSRSMLQRIDEYRKLIK